MKADTHHIKDCKKKLEEHLSVCKICLLTETQRALCFDGDALMEEYVLAMQHHKDCEDCEL